MHAMCRHSRLINSKHAWPQQRPAYLAQRVTQAKRRAAQQRQRALAHAVRKLARRARLGRLRKEAGDAGYQAAGQQDGAAQQVHLAQDLVQLMHCLEPATSDLYHGCLIRKAAFHVVSLQLHVCEDGSDQQRPSVAKAYERLRALQGSVPGMPGGVPPAQPGPPAAQMHGSA